MGTSLRHIGYLHFGPGSAAALVQFWRCDQWLGRGLWRQRGLWDRNAIKLRMAMTVYARTVLPMASAPAGQKCAWSHHESDGTASLNCWFLNAEDCQFQGQSTLCAPHYGLPHEEFLQQGQE